MPLLHSVTETTKSNIDILYKETLDVRKVKLEAPVNACLPVHVTERSDIS